MGRGLNSRMTRSLPPSALIGFLHLRFYVFLARDRRRTSSIKMGVSWFVVQTQPHAEEKARQHLCNQNIDCYLPRYRRMVRHARRQKMTLRPLFPGYLFVRLDPEECRWRSINGTVGVRRILTDGDMPLPINDRVIAEIRSREDENGAVKLRPSFARGQSIRLLQGPLAEVEGLFDEVRDQNRVYLLITLLGRQVRIQAPAELVVAA